MPPKRKHHETDDESEEVSVKKGKKKYYQKWKREYSHDFPELTESKKHGPTHAFCTVCSTDFTITHGGAFDCERHVQSAMHKNAKSASSRKISTFFGQPSTSSDALNTTRAEALMCRMMAENNLSLSSANYLTAMFREMFPDSKIAASMRCCRNKATAMIKEMSAMAMMDLAKRMNSRPWSLATDGSNDKDKKQFPLVVTIEGEDGLVTPQLLALPNCENNATGENIFQMVNQELSAHNVGWENCVAFGSDNAPVMTGVHKGVVAFVRQKQPNVHLARCCLHLVHIAAKKGAGCLPPVEDVLTDIFYYLQRSVNRQSELKELQQLYDVAQRKIIKHVCTRWLSIKRCLERLVDNWDPLLHFFRQESKSESEKSKNHKVQLIYNFLRSPTNKLFCQFLKYTLQVYDKVLVGLQKEEPMIHRLRPDMCELLRDLFSRFVIPTESAKLDVKLVQFQVKDKQKADADLLIGTAAKDMLAEPKKHNIREERIPDFFKAVRMYFVTVCQYLVDNLPLDDKVLVKAAVVDPRQRTSVTSSQLDYFLQTFPMLRGDAERDLVLEQFAQMQCSEMDLDEVERVDQNWFKLQKRFPELVRVMKGILTIPHSSAPCERLFSMVRKTCTNQRHSLHSDTTEALMVLKTQPAAKLSDASLQQLKGAYYQSLKK